MLICERVYGTNTDVIKSSFNGTGVNIALGNNENKNTKIKIGTKQSIINLNLLIIL